MGPKHTFSVTYYFLRNYNVRCEIPSVDMFVVNYFTYEYDNN
jgi:hypothetical protein